jgi:hypothetical protein
MDSTSHSSPLIPEIDQLRLLAICAVVINHLGATKLITKLNGLSDATSPILAIISGFLLFRHLDSYPRLVHKIRQRLTTLFLPYLVWTIIYFVVNQGVKELIIFYDPTYSILFNYRFFSWSFQEYFFKFFLAPNPVSFWYLQNLIVILPFTFILKGLLRSRYSLVPLLLLVFYAYVLKLPVYFSDRFLPFFILGLWLGLHYPEGLKQRTWSTLALVAAACLCLVVSRFIDLTNDQVENILKFPLHIGVFFFGFLSLRSVQSSSFVNYLKTKTHLSFIIHALHPMVLTILGGGLLFATHALHWKLPSSKLIEAFMGLFFFLVAIYLIQVMNQFLTRYAPKVLAILNGTRHKDIAAP